MGNADSGVPDVWYTREISERIDLAQPGIYEWRIYGVGSYIGKSRRLESRLREYPNNLRKMLAGLPYRAGNPEGYRHVHHALRAAILGRQAITLTVLENCEVADLNGRERHWIELRGTLNGGGVGRHATRRT